METAFWTLELYESNFEQECIDLLETIWINHIGFGSWFALRLIQEVYTEGGISKDMLIQITCAFAKRRICDSTIFHLLLRGAVTSAEWKPLFAHSSQYLKLEDAIKDCLKRGKLNEAWLLSRSLGIPEQWAILEELADSRNDALSLIKELGCSEYEKLCCAYVLVSLDEITWIESQKPIENTIPKEISYAIEEWSQITSLRKRRVMKHKPEGIMFLTKRSEQSQYISSEADIQIGLEDSLKQSEYWSNILESYMVNNKWKSDEHKEAFYSSLFPDDIPDEWSLVDREKSHGRGLGKPDEQSRPRFIYYTLQHSKSLELWNSQFKSETDCSMEWDSLYSEMKSKIKIELPLKPLKKVFELV